MLKLGALKQAVQEIQIANSYDAFLAVFQRCPDLLRDETLIMLQTFPNSDAKNAIVNLHKAVAQGQTFSGLIIPTASPIAKLARQVLNGGLTLSEAISRLRSLPASEQIGNDDIEGMLPFLTKNLERAPSMLAFVWCWLYFEAAYVAASPAVQKDFGLMLIGVMPDSSELTTYWKTLCERTIMHVEVSKETEFWAKLMSKYVNCLIQIQTNVADNIEIAILMCRTVLTICDRARFPTYWASAMNALGAALCLRVRGPKAENIEQAIICFESAMQVYTRQSSPKEWAVTMQGLGAAYRERIVGIKADNLERAISYNKSALDVATRDTNPADWALTMKSLGIAYSERILGDPAENMELAIDCCKKSLEVYSRESTPQYWAGAMNSLGATLFNRICGDRVENIENAILCYEQVFQIYTRVGAPIGWAMTMSNLGVAYNERIRGDRAENLERAIDCYRKALEVRTRDAFPQDWASTLNSLGIAYIVRIRGVPGENRKEAIRCYEQALEVRTPEADPQRWALLMCNLGSAYQRAQDIERAIECWRSALRVYTRSGDPKGWAGVTSNLARVYSERTCGELQENLQRAVESCEASVQVFTKETFPREWAGAMLVLGFVLGERGRGLLVEDNGRAVQCLRRAAKMYLDLQLPNDARNAFMVLGNVFYENGEYQEALAAYSGALEQAESIRFVALALERRANILRENVPLYERTIVCLMKLGRPLEAMELAERGKSRNLSDLLMLRDVRPKNAPQEVVEEYERMLFRARNLEEQLQYGDRHEVRTEVIGSVSRDALLRRQKEATRQELLQVTSRMQDLIDVIRDDDPEFLRKATTFTIEEARRLANEADATLALFRVTKAGSFVFLVFPNGDTDVVETPEFTADVLDEILVRWDGNQPVDGWVARYYAFQRAADPSVGAVAKQAWLIAMDAALGELYERLLKPVHQRLRIDQAPSDKLRRLVVVPNRGLAVLPLHACWWSEDGRRRYLLDEVVITYAPSLSTFRRCLERDRLWRTGKTFLGVANPAPPGDLVFAQWECEQIVSLLGNEECLKLGRELATRPEVMRLAGKYHWLHFACHGQYRLDAPLESSLMLAGGETLTLGEILESLVLRSAWLTVLSACETGLVDFREIADEHYGLPMAFLFAGSPTVWATLWTAYDPSTALLMVKAYEGLVQENKSKSQAVRDAQLWLRQATAEELLASLSQKEALHPSEGVVLSEVASWKREMRFGPSAKGRPYAHPYFWAGLHCVGA
ncbi:Sel1 repeat-containing protein [Rhizobiales bacterium GAS113]|nr:Sel1 repeat-containing protein [Rhizobiales bacterium GAS113]